MAPARRPAGARTRARTPPASRPAARWPPPTRDWRRARPPPKGASPPGVTTGCSFDECDLVDLAQRRRTLHDPLDRRFAEKPHPLFARGFLDLRGRPLLENHLPDVVREVEQLADRHPALEARATAFDAADPLVERLRVLERRIQTRFLEQRPR